MADPDRCTFRCLDCELVSLWSRTCDEYMTRLRRPISLKGFVQLWNCHQSDWEEAFTQWTVFSFWLAVVAGLVGNLLVILFYPKLFGAAIGSFVWYTALAYINAHLGWFAAVKRQGCCWLLLCCLEGRLFLLVWGVWGVIVGLARFIDSFQYVRHCKACFITTILQAFYAVVTIYMGVCLVRMWQHPHWRSRDVQPREMVPPAVAVVQPKGVGGEDVILPPQKVGVPTGVEPSAPPPPTQDTATPREAAIHCEV